MTTTTTTYHLLAITDELAARTHLGATERGNVTFCGVKLLIKGDTRFAGKYAKGAGYTSSTGLETVDCKACRRTGAWKITSSTGSATIAIPRYTGSRAKAAPEAAPVTEAKPPTRKRKSAATRAAAKAADDQAAE